MKAESAENNKEQPINPESSSENKGRWKLLSDCITKSHPRNLKYFIDPEVHHAEQLLLLRQGL